MEKEEIGFLAEVGKEGKITIPVEIRRQFDLKHGDRIYLQYLRKLKLGEKP